MFPPYKSSFCSSLSYFLETVFLRLFVGGVSCFSFSTGNETVNEGNETVVGVGVGVGVGDGVGNDVE